MNPLPIIFVGLLLGAFIPDSLQMDKVGTWAEFEGQMKSGGPFVLMLTDGTSPDSIPKMEQWCVKYPKVKCLYGIEKVNDPKDTFFAKFGNKETMAVVFFKGGSQTDISIGFQKAAVLDPAFAKISA